MQLHHWAIFAVVLVVGYYVGRNMPLGLPVLG
jgi:hypothetical protein